MNDLRDIAEGIVHAMQWGALAPESTIQVPLDECRWVRVAPARQGVVISAVQHSIGLTPAEVAARREALVGLAPLTRWAGALVGSVDSNGFEVLSTRIGSSMEADQVEALLADLFGWLADCSPVAASVVLPHGGLTV